MTQLGVVRSFSVSLSVPAGLKQASVREFSVSPEGDSLLLSGNDGYLHVLKLKVCAAVPSWANGLRRSASLSLCYHVYSIAVDVYVDTMSSF